MRRTLCVAVLAACAPKSPPAPPPVLLRLEAPATDGIVVDGSIDPAWTHATELTVPLSEGDVKLKAAHDGKRLYLLAIWTDDAPSLNRYWRYEGDLKWKKNEREDGFAVMWSPGALSEPFRAQACAIACHGNRHVYPGEGSGVLDFWYWGAEQCAVFPQARDLWLRQGDPHRLRGDRQPDDSDNLPNLSSKYEGPCAFPQFRRPGDDRILPYGKTLKEVTPDWITKYWKDEINVGREVPLDLLRARKGSRGDVAAAGKHHALGPKWVLEMARDFATGNTDDQPLGVGPVRFAVAVFRDAAGADHAVSGPIELRFLPAP